VNRWNSARSNFVFDLHHTEEIVIGVCQPDDNHRPGDISMDTESPPLSIVIRCAKDRLIIRSAAPVVQHEVEASTLTT
jgi:hypothetical protein